MAGAPGLRYGGRGARPELWGPWQSLERWNRMSNIEQGMSNFEGNTSGFSFDIRHSLFDILRFRSSLPRWGYQGAKPLAWQSSRARGVAATPREGTGQSRRREGRGGRSQWRSALPQAGLNGAWRECPDAPARSPQSRYLGPRSFPPAADSFYAIGAARCRGRLSNGVFYP